MGLKLFGKNILQVYAHHIMKVEYETVARQPKQSSFTLRKIDSCEISKELERVGTTVSVKNLNHLLSVNDGLCEGYIFGGGGIL